MYLQNSIVIQIAVLILGNIDFRDTGECTYINYTINQINENADLLFYITFSDALSKKV